MHNIHAMVYSGELPAENAYQYYCRNYCSNVACKAPTHKIWQSYFTDGCEYWKTFNDKSSNVRGVELEVKFNVGEYQFAGYIDLIRDKDGIEIIDHKSRKLEPFSNKYLYKPTQKDIFLDRYYRQLYLYSKPVFEKYGEFPKRLIFNCFRNQRRIVQSFDIEKYNKTQLWASKTVSEIVSNKDWSPSINEFKCANICGLHRVCEYYQLFTEQSPRKERMCFYL